MAEGGALRVQPKDARTVFRCLKENDHFNLDYLANLTVVDYPPDPATGGTGPAPVRYGAGRMDVVYHLYSIAKKHGPLALKITLPRTNPVVASATPIWRGAEFQEREAYDLYGVTFEGHPDLRRILLWDEFEGHPMRKDYVVEDQNVL
ncbi:MAG: NADH-quinone oxidoreductase subunit C [Candidatus Omnitrophica bacterium]|nr:NADH-quinone oxidoreductase subunit C [Candidatus Omnitrophota bacterium]